MNVSMVHVFNLYGWQGGRKPQPVACHESHHWSRRDHATFFHYLPPRCHPLQTNESASPLNKSVGEEIQKNSEVKMAKISHELEETADELEEVQENYGYMIRAHNDKMTEVDQLN
jgi:hypothetical protein